MKRVLTIIFLLLFLSGCSDNNVHMDRILNIRKEILESDGVVFDAAVTADYGDDLYTFHMQCQTDDQGSLTFRVTEPETLAGITGRIASDGGKLTFDDKVLAFEMIADGQASPVSAPWIMMKTLRSGYINACTSEDDGLYVIIDDSYEENALQLHITINEDDAPEKADIVWNNCRVLSLDIDNYDYL